MNKIIHTRYIIVLSIIFSLFIFSSKSSFSFEKALLLDLNIECSGKNNDWSKSWVDYFFAISTPYTFQGSRYWIATAKGEGHKKYDGDIGLNIFTGKKTNKDFRIKGEGIYLKNKNDDVFKFKFTSKGNKSIVEHLKQGVEGTGGKGKHRRECIIKLVNKVNASYGIRTDKNISVRDKKIESLLSKIDNFKKENEENTSNLEQLEKIKKENNKNVEILENQIVSLKKEIELKSQEKEEEAKRIALQFEEEKQIEEEKKQKEIKINNLKYKLGSSDLIVAQNLINDLKEFIKNNPDEFDIIKITELLIANKKIKDGIWGENSRENYQKLSDFVNNSVAFKSYNLAKEKERFENAMSTKNE